MRWLDWGCGFRVLQCPQTLHLRAGRVSPQQAAMAYDFNNVIFTAARVPQIIKNFQARHIARASVQRPYP